MVHLDVKKVGRIPGGGGWWTHGRGSAAAKTSKRGLGAKVGYTYLQSAADVAQILAGLDSVRAGIASGTFHRDPQLEDVHMNSKDRLQQNIGPVAGGLRTARSRNDQVAFDAQLWVRQTE